MEDAAKEDFTVSPTISGMPYRSFKQFKQFAKERAGDCYWMAIEILMERSKRLDLLEQSIEQYEEQDEQEADKPITLG